MRVLRSQLRLTTFLIDIIKAIDNYYLLNMYRNDNIVQ